MKKFNLILVLFGLLLFLSSCFDNRPVLYLYNWSDYMSPELIKKFEQENNCRVVSDYFDSNEAMYAKLRVSGGAYDIIVPSSYMAAIMKKEKMIKNFDKTKIPNFKYIDNKYSKKTEDPDMNYSIPYAISFTCLGYNSSRVSQLKPTWGAFGNKEYRKKITMLNDMREAMGAALKYLGFSLNTVDNDQLLQAKKLMLEWKINIAAYQSDEAKSSLAYNILNIIQCYNGDIIQMQEDNPDLRFIIPEEGTSIGVDTIVIPINAPNPELAYKFINFLNEPENCAENMDYISYLTPNNEALKLISSELLEEITISEELLRKSEVIKDLGADNTKYTKLWEEILASNE